MSKRRASIIFRVYPAAPIIGGWMWEVHASTRSASWVPEQGWAATEGIARERGDEASRRVHADLCDCGQAYRDGAAA